MLAGAWLAAKFCPAFVDHLHAIQAVELTVVSSARSCVVKAAFVKQLYQCSTKHTIPMQQMTEASCALHCKQIVTHIVDIAQVSAQHC